MRRLRSTGLTRNDNYGALTLHTDATVQDLCETLYTAVGAAAAGLMLSGRCVDPSSANLLGRRFHSTWKPTVHVPKNIYRKNLRGSRGFGAPNSAQALQNLATPLVALWGGGSAPRPGL